MTRIILKCTALVLVLSLSLCLFSGCELLPESPKPSGTVVPTDAPIPGDDVDPDKAFTAIDPDYFELLAEDCDVTIHTQAGIQVITFMLISAQPLKKYDVSIGSDQGVTARVRLTQAQMQAKMPLNVYLCYQNFDWKAYAQQVETDPTAAKELMDRYQQELEQHRYNRLFSYRVQVLTDNLFSNCKDEHNQWALPQETVEIQDLTVTVKGQSKTYHPRCLRLTSAPLPEEVKNGLSYIPVGPVQVNPSSDGRLYSDGFRYVSVPHTLITIKEFTLADHPDIVLNPSLVTSFYDGGGGSSSSIWMPGEENQVAEQETLELRWTDPAMAGVAGGAGLLYAIFDYERVNTSTLEPEPGRMIIPLVYNIFGNAYEYYAQAHDGVDVLSYYRDYVAVMQKDPKV